MGLGWDRNGTEMTEQWDSDGTMTGQRCDSDGKTSGHRCCSCSSQDLWEPLLRPGGCGREAGRAVLGGSVGFGMICLFWGDLLGLR